MRDVVVSETRVRGSSERKQEAHSGNSGFEAEERRPGQIPVLDDTIQPASGRQKASLAVVCAVKDINGAKKDLEAR